MLQDVSSKPIRDTVDDFVEGLKHFDKVNIVSFFSWALIQLHDPQEGNGLISAVELRHLLTGLGEKMSEEEVSLRYKDVNFYQIKWYQVESLIHGKEDSQGNINYEEFVKMVLAQ